MLFTKIHITLRGKFKVWLIIYPLPWLNILLYSWQIMTGIFQSWAKYENCIFVFLLYSLPRSHSNITAYELLPITLQNYPELFTSKGKQMVNNKHNIHLKYENECTHCYCLISDIIFILLLLLLPYASVAYMPQYWKDKH